MFARHIVRKYLYTFLEPILKPTTGRDGADWGSQFEGYDYIYTVAAWSYWWTRKRTSKNET